MDISSGSWHQDYEGVGLRRGSGRDGMRSHRKQEGIDSLTNIDWAFTVFHTVLGPGDMAANKVGRAPASGSHSDNEDINKYRRYWILMSAMKKTKWGEVTE